jgi:hypothetical protein
MFKLQSVNNIVIAPARTDSEVDKRIAVTKMAHTDNGILSREIFLWCMLRIVEIKLIAPIIEDIPATCKEKMIKSIERSL